MPNRNVLGLGFWVRMLVVWWGLVASVQAAALANGGFTSGIIAIAHQQDSYTFTANAGEGVQVRIGKTSGTLRPRIDLYSPTGSAVGSHWGSSVGALGFSAPTSGTYTVVVSDYPSDNNGTGTYNLYMARAPGANEGGTLPNGGQPTAGTIDIGELDSYTFTANAGEGVQVRIGKTSGTLRPRIDLYGPTGSAVGSHWGSSVGALGFSAPTSGTYTVVVSDYPSDNNGTGTYNLYMARAPGANEGGQLYNGSSQSDQIDLGDVDTYTFTANAGEPFQISTARTSGTLAPAIALYEPNGTFVTSVNSTASASLSRTATKSGTYTIMVFDYPTDHAGTGTYTITLTGSGGTPPSVDSSADSPLPLWALGLLASMLSIGSVHGMRRWRS